MQRKNHLLKNHRHGIAMIMAIAVIVILGTIMAVMLQLTALGSKQTINDYLHEQAILLSRSATEFTLLRISGTDRSIANNCLTSLSGEYENIFDINISISYIGLSGTNVVSECANDCATTKDECFIANSNVDDANSKGSVLLDIIVTSRDGTSDDPIRYHRRTLQKL